jgi:crotonobetainyl-CoA:carnitine CoA-transferase CaiB-like acyl-CoA transferase
VSLAWKSMSRNKRCVTLDLRHPDGRDLFHGLLDVSDVLIINNRPSALARWASTTNRCTNATRVS